MEKVVGTLIGENGKRVKLTISKEAQEELERLKEELNLDDISDKIICSTPRPTFLALEAKHRSIGEVANMFSSMTFQAKREAYKELFEEIEDSKAREVIQQKYEKNEKLFKRFLHERF